MIQDIHKEVNRLAKSKKGPPNFKRVFGAWDSDGSGEIDIGEFRTGLANMGFELNPLKIAQIASIFDADNSGSIDYEEFVKFVESENLEDAVTSVRKAENKRKKES